LVQIFQNIKPQNLIIARTKISSMTKDKGFVIPKIEREKAFQHNKVSEEEE
jgi:hypothetical protein